MTDLLALVTIGQSPRVDVLPDLLPALAGQRYAEYGALDEATAAELAAIAPRDGEVPLVSRMRDGSRVSMVHGRALPFIAAAVERAAADGAGAALLMCTGHFEPFETSIPVYAAEPLAQEAIAATVTGFGVLNPVPEQVEESRGRWEARVGGRVPVAAADPYTASDRMLAAAARELAAAGATSIVLDCFGYSAAMAAVVHAATGLPVHLTRTIAARAALAALHAD
ncbi:AroM family protein [Microbacterium sp. 1.5R]|uniref:AroM family protein n=1 Tax=Microbacterium sp. 1.5R TaxID=1916917 RepID=UPI0011A397B5|nr:AroM family protein [Microbacterium sp. 1.5R]